MWPGNQWIDIGCLEWSARLTWRGSAPLCTTRSAGYACPQPESPLSSPTLEPGGGIPSISALFAETFTDVTENIQGYLMVALALMAVMIPFSLVLTFVGMFGLYMALGIGVFASILGGAAIGEATGDSDLGGIVTVIGSVGSSVLAFLVFFALILLMAAAMAPLSASLDRAIAAHQRGEAPLTFNAAFATIRQDMMSAFGAVALVSATSLVGVFFCYVGAFVPAFFFSFAFPMVALHRKGAREAMRICATHAMARPMEHFVFMLAFVGTSLVAAYIPLLGPVFTLAFHVRAYRKMFGDGPEPVL